MVWDHLEMWPNLARQVGQPAEPCLNIALQKRVDSSANEGFATSSRARHQHTFVRLPNQPRSGDV